MNAERNPTYRLLNTLTGKYITENIGDEFVSKTKEERVKYLTELAEEAGIEPEESDIEGLSEISESQEFIEYLRKALKKYKEEPKSNLPDPREGL